MAHIQDLTKPPTIADPGIVQVDLVEPIKEANNSNVTSSVTDFERADYMHRTEEAVKKREALKTEADNAAQKLKETEENNTLGGLAKIGPAFLNAARGAVKGGPLALAGAIYEISKAAYEAITYQGDVQKIADHKDGTNLALQNYEQGYLKNLYGEKAPTCADGRPVRNDVFDATCRQLFDASPKKNKRGLG